MSSVKGIHPVRELKMQKRQVSTVGDAALKSQFVPLNRRANVEGAYYPHVMAGVDRLREEGYMGTGIRVAVVDSGVDYKHPALGGCFGKGCLVEFGYNLLDNTGDPYDDCDGHGMRNKSSCLMLISVAHLFQVLMSPAFLLPRQITPTISPELRQT
jgi:hypothetical protein